MAPHELEIELSERAVMEKSAESIPTLRQLKDLGVSLTVDDFGTSYSSLSLLKQLPIDRLKIDTSFVAGLPGNADNVAITAAVIALARSLSLEVVAEGVECRAQHDFLLANGCDLFQGYLVTMPVKADELPALLEGDRVRHATMADAEA